MERRKKCFEFTVLDIGDFSPIEARMHDVARSCLTFSHAEYSGIRVGASLLLDDNTIVGGANIENPSYSLTMCAERTAIFKALTESPKNKIIALMIVVDGNVRYPFSPCGACRQVISHIMKKQNHPITIYFPFSENKFVKIDAEHLLPFGFDF